MCVCVGGGREREVRYIVHASKMYVQEYVYTCIRE